MSIIIYICNLKQFILFYIFDTNFLAMTQKLVQT